MDYLILRRLRIAALLLLVGCVPLLAQAQEQEVSVNLRNVSLTELFSSIEKQTTYRFAYRDVVIDKKKDVTIQREKVPVTAILDDILPQKRLQYDVVSSKSIVISEKKQAGEQSSSGVKKKITGVVTDANGEPVIGANVVERGTTNGTVTDMDGKFTLHVAEKGLLTISYIGYNNQEIALNGKSSFTIKLQEDSETLEEVVVVGYGTQKKTNLTGAVAVVSSEELSKKMVGQSSMALQGVMPGVTVTQTSGQPGKDGGTIRIRGIGTLPDSDSSPLTLIDGVEMNINNVDPNLIESISVLKDAASSAIYGSRAANGVILITTKRAKTGEFSVSYNGYAGWQNPTDLRHPVDAVSHMQMMNIANTNVGKNPIFGNEQINNTISGKDRDKYPNTDWQKLIYNGSGFQQNHFVTLNGGSEKMRVLAAIGYYDQQGIVDNTNYKRYTARFNTDMQLSNRFSVKIDVYGRLMKMEEPSSGVTGDDSLLYWLNRMPATQPAILSNGLMGIGWDGDNPYAKIYESGMNRENTPSLAATGSLKYEFTNWLDLTAAYSLHFVPKENTKFNNSVTTYYPNGDVAYVKPAKNSLSETRTNTLNQDFKAMLNFNKRFGDHTVKALAGFSQEAYVSKWISASRLDFIFPEYPVLDAGSIEDMKNGGTGDEWVLRSLYGRINYDYQDKYLFEANIRYDGSSRFASGHKWGLFPSFSAGWRISEEAFWEPAKNIVDNLKIRASWGQLGNQLIGNYPFASFVNYGTAIMGGQAVSTAFLEAMANPEISWEKTTMTNIGLDVSLLSKLSVNFDYYYRRTSDILLKLDIPTFTGLKAPYQNAGVVDNKGWDLGITWRDAIADFQYSATFVLSDVKNKIVDTKGVKRTGITVNNEGYPINSLYGLEAIGYITDADYDANGKYAGATQYGNFGPGDIKYKDQNKDGVINDKDETIIGSTIPRFNFSLNLNASWKNFDMSMFWQGVGKADGYLNGNATMPFLMGGTAQEMHKDYWTPENQDAAFPRLAFNEINNEKNSTFWMKSAAYLRLKNLQIGYSIPQAVLSKFFVKKLRIYVSGQNLFTIDKFWDGFDVEAPVGNGSYYPQVKLYSVGLDIKF